MYSLEDGLTQAGDIKRRHISPHNAMAFFPVYEFDAGLLLKKVHIKFHAPAKALVKIPVTLRHDDRAVNASYLKFFPLIPVQIALNALRLAIRPVRHEVGIKLSHRLLLL